MLLICFLIFMISSMLIGASNLSADSTGVGLTIRWSIAEISAMRWSATGSFKSCVVTDSAAVLRSVVVDMLHKKIEILKKIEQNSKENKSLTVPRQRRQFDEAGRCRFKQIIFIDSLILSTLSIVGK
jgi:Na+/pantothenate symporter